MEERTQLIQVAQNFSEQVPDTDGADRPTKKIMTDLTYPKHVATPSKPKMPGAVYELGASCEPHLRLL